jgi:hypothetical protein
MRSDSDIKRDVEDELRWTPDIDPTDIAVGREERRRHADRVRSQLRPEV